MNREQSLLLSCYVNASKFCEDTQRSFGLRERKKSFPSLSKRGRRPVSLGKRTDFLYDTDFQMCIISAYKSITLKIYKHKNAWTLSQIQFCSEFLMHYLHKSYSTPCLPQNKLHGHCFRFSLGTSSCPRRNCKQ